MNICLNNRDTGDLSHNRAHYDATVMYSELTCRSNHYNLMTVTFEMFFNRSINNIMRISTKKLKHMSNFCIKYYHKEFSWH